MRTSQPERNLIFKPITTTGMDTNQTSDKKIPLMLSGLELHLVREAMNYMTLALAHPKKTFELTEDGRKHFNILTGMSLGIGIKLMLPIPQFTDLECYVMLMAVETMRNKCELLIKDPELLKGDDVLGNEQLQQMLTLSETVTTKLNQVRGKEFIMDHTLKFDPRFFKEKTA